MVSTIPIVIYAVLSHLNRCNSFSRYCAIVLEKRRSQKIDDLPVLATCRSGTLTMLPAKLTVLLPIEALDNV